MPVGLVDKPFEQRRDLLVVDLSGAGGHVGVAGGPQSGKSTLLRTLITALALTHTPRRGAVLLPGLRRRRPLTLAGSAARRRRRGTAGPRAGAPDRRRGDDAARPPRAVLRRARHRLHAAYRRRRAAGEFPDEPVRRRVPGRRRLGHAPPGVRRPDPEVQRARRPRPQLRRPPGDRHHPLVGAVRARCATRSAPASNCGWATRWTPRSTCARPRTVPAAPAGASPPTADALPRRAAPPGRQRLPRRPRRRRRRPGRRGRPSTGPAPPPRRCGCCRTGSRRRTARTRGHRGRRHASAARHRPGLPGAGLARLQPYAAPDRGRRHRERQDQPAAADRQGHHRRATPRARRGSCWSTSAATLVDAMPEEYRLGHAVSAGQPASETIEGAARRDEDPCPRRGHRARPAAPARLVDRPAAVHPGRRLRHGLGATPSRAPSSRSSTTWPWAPRWACTWSSPAARWAPAAASATRSSAGSRRSTPRPSCCPARPRRAVSSAT